MEKIIITAILLLFSLNSCSDDSGTDPSSGFVGATFQFEDGQTWDYERYYYRYVDGSLQFETDIYYLAEYDGILWGNESYKYHNSLDSVERNSGLYVVMGTTEEGLFVKNRRTELFEDIFPEVKDTWHKLIDFKNESWTQFDLEKDSIIDGEMFKAKYSYSGKKIKDTTVTYQEIEHSATIYELSYEHFIEPNGPEFSNDKRIYHFTIIDDVGIYKRQEVNQLGEKPLGYIILNNHK